MATETKHSMSWRLTDPLATPSAPLPPTGILQRRATLSSTGHRAESFLSKKLRQLRRGRRIQDPAIPAAEEEEGAPAPRGVKPIVNTTEVLRTILPHVESESTSTDSPAGIFIPEFDSLAAYLISDESAKALWEREIKRLADVVENPDRALRFSEQSFLAEGSQRGHEKLSKLSLSIMIALSICSIDNECINMAYCPPLSSKKKLLRLMQQVGNQPQGETIEVDDHSNRQEDGPLNAVYCLIDYISAVLARLITQSATGDYWQNNLLGVLTKMTTKMKMLLLDLRANSSVALKYAEMALDSHEDAGGNATGDPEDEDDCDEVLRTLSVNTKEGLTSTEEADLVLYCANQSKFRSGIVTVLRYVLLSLRYLNRSGLPATAYDVCAVVYETGFEGFKALLYQDRDHEYTATSDLDNLNTAHSAFSILHQTILHLKEQRGPDSPHDCKLRTIIEWFYAEEENGEQSTNGRVTQPDKGSFHLPTRTLILRSMEDVVTVMVPLAIISPVVAANFTSFRHMIALTAGTDDVVRPYVETQFNAFARMYSDDFYDSSRRRDVLLLAQAVKDGLFSRCSLIAGTDLKGASSSKTSNTKQLQKLRDLTEEMDQWIIDEKSVTVNCGWYVWSVIIVAIILVVGGLVIGFTVENKITGVDPFNITTYAWVLSAFIVLICKSTQVENWPWRDFLLQRVRCRSVSELHAVTGINEQLILAKLLNDERGGILKTRGPYNSVFERKSEDGFSIDHPLKTRTMLLNGITPLKVVTPRGHALVCLDARRGTDLKVVEHQGLEREQHLVCENVRRQSQRTQKGSGASPSTVRLQLTASKDLRWKRVQGVYNEIDAVFV